MKTVIMSSVLVNFLIMGCATTQTPKECIAEQKQQQFTENEYARQSVTAELCIKKQQTGFELVQPNEENK